MAWYIESYQELGRHPKTVRLAKHLKISKPTAVGHLHYLWWWCMDYAICGNLSKFTHDEIADAGAWEGDPDEFVNALVTAGFLDRVGKSISIHDWEDYGGKIIQKRRADAERRAEARNRRLERMSDVCPSDVHRTYDVCPTEVRVSEAKRSESKRSEAKTPARAREDGDDALSEEEMGAVEDEPGEPSMFTEFMSIYPKKADRTNALHEWHRLHLSPQTAGDIIVGVRRQMDAGMFGDDYRFIPLASTYLKKRRWADPVPPRMTDGSNGNGKRASPLAGVPVSLVQYGRDILKLSDDEILVHDFAPDIRAKKVRA